MKIIALYRDEDVKICEDYSKLTEFWKRLMCKKLTIFFIILREISRFGKIAVE